MSDWHRFNEQFRETSDERKRTLEANWNLIADLSACLTDEGADWSLEGLQNMRRRVANAVPDPICPDWLREFRDPPVGTP